MLNDQKRSLAGHPSRAKRLSPELSEFLNMLDALEVQMSRHQAHVAPGQ